MIRYRTGIALAFALIFAAMAIAASSESVQLKPRKFYPATNWSLVVVTGDEDEDRARKPTASDLTHDRCVKFLFAIYDDPHRELNFPCRKVKP